MNAFARVVVVTLLLVFYLATTLPDIVLPWHPTGSFGMSADATGTVTRVLPGFAADRAGIHLGDRIDFAATPFESSRYLEAGIDDAAPGARARFTLERSGVARTYDLIADRFARSAADDVTDVLSTLALDAVAIITAWLLLRRPSRMTWAFFLYGIGSAGIAVTFIAYLPAIAVAVAYGIEGFVGFQALWLFIFALRFPNDRPSRPGVIAERIALGMLPILIPLNLWAIAGYLFGRPPPPLLIESFGWLSVATVVATALVFVATYLNARTSDRARIRWVMLGLIVGASGQLSVNLFLVLFAAAPWPIWVSNLLQSFQIFVAIAVAYAVIRHRVFDVRFFIGRALVYAVVTGLAISVLSLIDLAVGKLLAGTRLAAIGEAGLAVLVGLGLSGVHKRIESFVDVTLFRSRLQAQARLRRVARGLGHATTREGVEHVVVHEPLEAFALTSAAAFHRGENGGFVRGESVGWEHASLQHVDAEHTLVLQLLGSSEPLIMRALNFAPGALPDGERRPSFALPILIRSRLEAIVFYGPHESQEELDPAELETLERLLADAAAAYDHVRAVLADRRLSELETEIVRLRALRAVR